MSRHVEVSRRIAASPDTVWNALSDITRMGEWSPECHTCEWKDDSAARGVGARFFGHNRNGDKEWTTEAEITAWEPGRRLGFDGVFADLRFASWSYTIEPADGGGCVVTETWDDGRPEQFIEATVAISGVEDRAEHNRRGMEETLSRLAAAVEAGG
ncbi:MAG TPA: SRPBCC family protein [Acidimicrobiales bacterium]|nr:SRPBCC family protein [Acidimicrobiales bacterium]